jgi:plasmid maintenance system antidote protein VapI
MSVHTRAHPIKERCTKEVVSEKEQNDWRRVLHVTEETEAGLVLKGARLKEELTQKELADKLGVKQHHLSEMEHGRRSIGKMMARRLAKILRVDYRIFL